MHRNPIKCDLKAPNQREKKLIQRYSTRFCENQSIGYLYDFKSDQFKHGLDFDLM